MSTADIAVIVNGAEVVAAIAAGTVLCWKLLDKVRLVAHPEDAPERPAPLPVLAHPLPPLTARRQEAYNRLRGAKTPGEAAAELGIEAPSTARDYERRYAASVAAQNGAAS